MSITSLAIEGDTLLVTTEAGYRFALDLKTKKVVDLGREAFEGYGWI